MRVSIESVLEALKSYQCKNWRKDLDTNEGALLVDVLSTGETNLTGKEELIALAKHIVKELEHV